MHFSLEYFPVGAKIILTLTIQTRGIIILPVILKCCSKSFLHNQASVKPDDLCCYLHLKQEVCVVLILPVLYATQWLCCCSHGHCGHISKCITPALQACIKLVFKFAQTAEIPIMRSTSWGETCSPSVSFIHSYLLSVAHSALGLRHFIT